MRLRRRYRLAELSSDRRVGAQSRRQLRDEQRHWLRLQWRLIVMAGAFASVVAAAIHAFAWKPVAPYVVGAVLTSAGWWIYTLMLETGGSQPLPMLRALATRMDALIADGEGAQDFAVLGRSEQ